MRKGRKPDKHEDKDKMGVDDKITLIAQRR